MNVFCSCCFSGCCFLLLTWVRLITWWPLSKSRPTISSSIAQVRVMLAEFVRISVINCKKNKTCNTSLNSPHYAPFCNILSFLSPLYCSPNSSSSLSHIWSSTQTAPHHSHPGSVPFTAATIPLQFDVVWTFWLIFVLNILWKTYLWFDLISQYYFLRAKMYTVSHIYKTFTHTTKQILQTYITSDITKKNLRQSSPNKEAGYLLLLKKVGLMIVNDWCFLQLFFIYFFRIRVVGLL